MRRQGFASAIALFLVGLMLLGQGFSFAGNEKLTAFQVNYNLPAVAALVVREGRTLFSEIRGFADMEGDRPLKDTVELQLGSMASLMTEIALVESLHAHRIEIGSEIAPYLPSDVQDRPGFAGLTFSDLLLHTSGIPATKSGTVSTSPISDSFRSQALPYLKTYRFAPLFARGAYSMASNVNTVLSGILLEEIAGMPYEQYLAERFYHRLGMHRTAERMLHPGAPVEAVAYDVVGGRSIPAHPYFGRLIASDSLITTTEDMERFLQHATREEVERWESIGVLSRQFGGNRLAFGQSYGFQVIDYRGEEVFVHDAKIPGAQSRILLIPRLKLGMFLYFNTNSAEAMSKMTDALLAEYMGGRASVQKKDYVAVDNLSKLAAYYRPINSSKETSEKIEELLRQINISKIDGGLLIGRDFYKPLSETSFYCESLDQLVEFRTDDEGRLQYLILGDRMYRRVLAHQSLTLLGALFFLLIFVVGLTIVLLFRRWKELYHERVDARPRRIAMVHSVLLALLWLACRFAVGSADEWTWAYGAGGAWTILRWGGWLIPISSGLLIAELTKTRDDYRWRGLLTLVIRVNLVLSLLFFWVLFQYHLVWRW